MNTSDCVPRGQSDIRDRGLDAGLDLRSHGVVRMLVPFLSNLRLLLLLAAVGALIAVHERPTLSRRVPVTEDGGTRAWASMPVRGEEVSALSERSSSREGSRGSARTDLNPDYLVRPGDHITLRMWGAVDYADVVVVDAQGNIFVPDIGPIAGRRVSETAICPRIRRAVRHRVHPERQRLHEPGGYQPGSRLRHGLREAPGELCRRVVRLPSLLPESGRGSGPEAREATASVTGQEGRRDPAGDRSLRVSPRRCSLARASVHGRRHHSW